MRTGFLIRLFWAFIFVAVFCSGVEAQSMFYDALTLAKNINSDGELTGTNTVYSILARYSQKANPSNSDLDNEFDGAPGKNPFIIISSSPHGMELFNSAASLQNIGQLDITNLVDGFAKFLVERTKEELATAFFNEFVNVISDERYKDLRTLFPQTYATLSAIGNQIYNYNAYIGALRESFEKDLDGLLINLPLVINNGNNSAFFNNHPVLKAVSLSSIYIGNAMQLKENPGQIIAGFDTTLLNGINVKYPAVKGAVQTLQLFSESIRSLNPDRYWVSADSLKLLLNSSAARNIYFGLIYQKCGNIVYGQGDSLRSILRKAYNVNQYAASIVNYVSGFDDLAQIVTNNIKNIEGKSNDKLTFTDYYELYNSSLNLIEYASNVYMLPELSRLKPGEDFQRYMTMLRTGGNIALDIDKRNYSAAIINTFQLYNFAFTASDKADSGSVCFKNAQKIKNFILRYGSFMASVVQAQNSDDIAKAIDAVSLPPGSYRIKRENSFDISLNSYVGIFGGYESIDKRPFHGWNFNSWGITAPVGIAFSRGFGSSISAFVSIFDVGAIASYRFGDDTTKQVPTIKLKNIISPGIFISWGLPDCPISVNLGFQLGPSLHEVTSKENTVNPNIYWRSSLSVCVDIPLIDFYTKPKE